MTSSEEPRIHVTEHGPYRVVGDVEIYDAEGNLRKSTGTWCLCRCGGSRNKPFCDVTHGLKNFDGTEAGDHSSIEDRRDTYPADGVTVYDDRSRCAHFGNCTSTLPSVFRHAEEPFVDAHGAPPEQIPDVVRGCPSGALAFALGDDPATVEEQLPAAVRPIVDGPYRIQGDIPVIGADGRPYERRNRQTLCRCGQSNNKPFCDGSHWYAGFRDPLPAELVKQAPTLLEAAGGIAALEHLTSVFYDNILHEPDPVLEPVFRGMDAEHPKHVAAWLAETFGGPATYTEHHGGYEHMLEKHRDLGLTETQRRQWVSRMSATFDIVGLNPDPGFRAALVGYIEWGTRLAVHNSQPGADVVLHAPIPLWGWGMTPPFEPQQWDDPQAAAQGRVRYAQEQAAEAAQQAAQQQADRPAAVPAEQR